MDADVKLNGNTTTIEGDVVSTTAADFVMNSPGRRSGGGNRRALVHDFQDGLTVNWASDYPGCVTVEGFRLNLHQADVVLDYAPRRKNATPWRRALVHDFNDGLTINWARDYPGGVTINGPLKINGNVTVDGILDVNSPYAKDIGRLHEKLAAYGAIIDGLTERIAKLEG